MFDGQHPPAGEATFEAEMTNLGSAVGPAPLPTCLPGFELLELLTRHNLRILKIWMPWNPFLK